MFADGSNGSVELVDDSIVIRRKGFANILTQGVQGDKQVPLKNIMAVQFRSAGSMMAGLIQFSILGGREFRGGMLEATKDENAVMFTREQEAAFVALRDIVQVRINRPDTSDRASSAGELERLAALHEKGHLTAEEFADAKKQIFSRPVPEQNVSSPPPTHDLPNNQLTALEEQKGGCLKGGMITVIAIIALLFFIGIANPGVKWGERGYKPNISDQCRAVWASMNVDADRYVKAICTPNEQHEIAGYRPE